MTDRASSSTLSLPRASSLEPLRVSGRASPPAILRWYDTTPREMENEKGEEERERERETIEGRGRGRELRPNVSRLITPTTCLWPTSRVASTRIPSQKSDRKSAYLPHAYRDVISDFFTVGGKK